MVSYVHVQGRLTRDPEIKEVQTKTGKVEVYERSIASNNYIAKKSTVVFYNVNLWPGRAEYLKKNLVKGSATVITGQFYQNTFVDKNKNEKTVNCINLHAIHLSVCDHPSDKPAEFERMNDNDVVTDSMVGTQPSNDLESGSRPSKRHKK